MINKLLDFKSFILLVALTICNCNSFAKSNLFQAKDIVYLEIDKKKLIARLKTLPPIGEKSKLLTKPFKIAIGKIRGNKEKRGDNKTPEGIYLSQPHITKNLYRGKYGDLAIPINYPNPYDLHMKKTGYGIWLHGAGNDKRIKPSHTMQMSEYLPDSELVIIPDATHFNIVRSKKYLGIVSNSIFQFLQ